jgi:broad specificity phosphatase PhoE
MSKEEKAILIRHGESSHNKENIFAGSLLDTQLTPEGIKEAKKLAINITNNYKFDFIICSSLLRSYQTAFIFKKCQDNKYDKKIPVIKTPLLNEVNIGVLTGLNPSQALTQYPQDLKNVRSTNIEDWSFNQGESFPILKKRYLELTKFLEKYKNKNVLLVGHALFNQFILKNTLGEITPDFNHNFFIELPLSKKKEDYK